MLIGKLYFHPVSSSVFSKNRRKNKFFHYSILMNKTSGNNKNTHRNRTQKIFNTIMLRDNAMHSFLTGIHLECCLFTINYTYNAISKKITSKFPPGCC